MYLCSYFLSHGVVLDNEFSRQKTRQAMTVTHVVFVVFRVFLKWLGD